MLFKCTGEVGIRVAIGGFRKLRIANLPLPRTLMQTLKPPSRFPPPSGDVERRIRIRLFQRASTVVVEG